MSARRSATRGSASLAVEYLLAFVCFLLLGALMFLATPTAGDFAWSDAPRHALNGIFVHDLIADLPLGDPRQYAIQYYLKYPALTILFYPPLFSVFLAAAYSLLGFSHQVAQGVVAGFHVLLAFGAYLLARNWLRHWYAVAVALLLAAAPEVAYWGRQVMLDIPAYSLLVLAAVPFIRYMDQGRPRDLYLTVVLYAAALYTKQTPLFFTGALALGLLASRGLTLFRDRSLWLSGALLVVLLIPLAVMQLAFGQVNTDSVLGSLRADVARTSLAAWTFYAEQLPSQLGWPALILSVGYVIGAAVRPAWRIPRSHLVFLLSWFVLGYVFFSLISVREPRHDLMVLFPITLFAVLCVQRLAGESRSPRGVAFAIGLALATGAYGLTQRPVPYVRGYAEAARVLMAQAPERSLILFAGYRDGSFIFNMRAGNRPDLAVARADKLLLRVSIERARGVDDRNLAKEEIIALIRRHAIRYVLAQTGFWIDLPSMAALHELLQDRSRFEPVRRIRTEANFPNQDRELVVYRYLGEVSPEPAPMSVEMLGVGTNFTSQ